MENSRTLSVRYEVQRFYPAACPNCSRAFSNEEKDFIVIDSPEGRHITETRKDMIACLKCGHEMERQLLSCVSAKTPEEAKEFLQKGYVNLRPVRCESSSDELICLRYEGNSLPRVQLKSSA